MELGLVSEPVSHQESALQKEDPLSLVSLHKKKKKR